MIDHKTRKHALLSASGADRWMNCTPSPRLEEEFPEEEASDFAKEGTLAHEFGDAILRNFNKELTNKELAAILKTLRKHKLYTAEMEDQVEKYTDFVVELLNQVRQKTPGAILMIEERLDFSHLVEEGFGTGDVTIIADDVMYIVDLKYGKGIMVEAEDNPQLKLYAIAAHRAAEMMFDINTITMYIMQPRLDHVSSATISVEDLLAWGENEVKPKAELAYEGEGKQVPGDWCRWCKAKPKCRAFAEQNLAMARFEFTEPMLLTDEELVEVYEQQPRLVEWVNSVTGYMIGEANKGTKFPGYKLVEGRSTRRWGDEEAAIAALKARRIPQREFLNVKLKGLGDMEKFLGPKRFSEILVDHVVKPPGKPTLAKESDKRPALGSEESAKEDFKVV